jgi:chromosome partitioning protein
MTARVIAFINYKGGVAKTTTTYHVGCSLAQHLRKRVLLIDIDPQTNLTFLCASIEEWEEFKRETGTIATMYQRFLDKQPVDTKRYIWRQPVGAAIKQRIQNLDLVQHPAIRRRVLRRPCPRSGRRNGPYRSGEGAWLACYRCRYR